MTMQACIGLCEPPCASCAAIRATTARLTPGSEIRTGLCAACGAPLVADAGADRAVCAVCNHTTALPVRISEAELAAAIASMAGSETRSELRYDPLRRPPIEPELADLGADDPGGVKWLCGAFIAARGALSRTETGDSGYRAAGATARPSDEEQLCVWIALRLVELLGRRGSWLLARPFLETLVDAARDDGHRYLAYAALARVASASGDPAAAERWLAFCAPEPRFLALRAVSRDRRVCVALGRGDWPAVDALTSDRDFVPMAWPERLRLDLSRVVLEERAGNVKRAVSTMRAALDAHLTSDIEDAIAREPTLAGARTAWERIRALEKKKALRPVWFTLVLGGLLFIAGGFAMLLAPSVVMTCERTAARTASCTIEKNLLGLELGRRVVPDVSGATKERAGKNSYRLALKTPSGIDAPDSAAGPDAELRVDIVNGFLADPSRPSLTLVWDHEIALLGGITALLASLLMFGYAAIRRARIELESRE